MRHVGAQPALGGDEHQDAQDQEQADRVGGGLLKDLRVRSLRIHGGRGDRQVLRGHDLADAAADGVGGQQDVRIEAGARGGGGLQVREQSAAEVRSRRRRSDPARMGERKAKAAPVVARAAPIEVVCPEKFMTKARAITEAIVRIAMRSE